MCWFTACRSRDSTSWRQWWTILGCIGAMHSQLGTNLHFYQGKLKRHGQLRNVVTLYKYVFPHWSGAHVNAAAQQDNRHCQEVVHMKLAVNKFLSSNTYEKRLMSRFRKMGWNIMPTSHGKLACSSCICSHWSWNLSGWRSSPLSRWCCQWWRQTRSMPNCWACARSDITMVTDRITRTIKRHGGITVVVHSILTFLTDCDVWHLWWTWRWQIVHKMMGYQWLLSSWHHHDDQWDFHGMCGS